MSLTQPKRAIFHVFGANLARLTTYDFLPAFSQSVRNFVASPLGWLVLASVLASVCAVLISPRVWSIFVGLIALTGFGLVWPLFTLRTVRLWLAFARDRVVEGEAVRVTALIENLSPVPAFGLSLRGELQTSEVDKSTGGELAARLPQCAGWQQTECHWQFRPPHRGVYPLNPPYLSTGFPFGLWDARRKAKQSLPLIVWPQMLPVGPVPISRTEALLDGNVNRNRAGSDSELMGVRPYRRGDSPRRIHWAQSARHDRLIVCELESTARPTVRIILDLESAIHTGGPQGSREWAIRIAASFAKGWIDAGAQVSLLADGIDLPLASGAVQISRILDALAKAPHGSTLPLDAMIHGSSLKGVGVNVVVTTDQRVRALRRPGFHDLRWIVLKAHRFSSGEQSLPSTTHEALRVAQAPWLTIESPDQVRYALRHGWTEARNGS